MKDNFESKEKEIFMKGYEKFVEKGSELDHQVI